MTQKDEMKVVKEKLNEVSEMLEEMRTHLSVLSEDQALWTPPSEEEVWPVQRAVTHCINCEHRAVTELHRALDGNPTPETTGADSAIFAWFGPTSYALARMVEELRRQVEELAERLKPSDLQIEAVRYPNHPPRKLLDYVDVMRGHTTSHLNGIRKKMDVMPTTKQWAPEVREAYPHFGRGASERGETEA